MTHYILLCVLVIFWLWMSVLSIWVVSQITIATFCWAVKNYPKRKCSEQPKSNALYYMANHMVTQDAPINATAAISNTIITDGWVVVPEVATDSMADAGCHVQMLRSDVMSSDWSGGSDLTNRMWAKESYRAMISECATAVVTDAIVDRAALALAKLHMLRKHGPEPEQKPTGVNSDWYERSLQMAAKDPEIREQARTAILSIFEVPNA